MSQLWIDLIAATAWPTVALIALLFLLPGGKLGDILKNLSAIPTSIGDLKEQVSQLKEAEARILDASGQISHLSEHLNKISDQVEKTKELAADLVSASITGSPSEDAPKSGPTSIAATEGMTPLQMYEAIVSSWAALSDLIRDRVGDGSFDARSVGFAARRLADNRRKNPISRDAAEKIDSLFSTMKRFRRLRGTLDSWMNEEIYSSVYRDIDDMIKALNKTAPPITP
jgi:hypothetical protein